MQSPMSGIRKRHGIHRKIRPGRFLRCRRNAGRPQRIPTSIRETARTPWQQIPLPPALQRGLYPLRDLHIPRRPLPHARNPHTCRRRLRNQCPAPLQNSQSPLHKRPQHSNLLRPPAILTPLRPPKTHLIPHPLPPEAPTTWLSSAWMHQA